ncbi:hypothetical protein NYE48_27880 [Paenibacillus sp. FSL M7-1455]|uniref:hypothetical protein n=1 Tax=Paenibacillus sp. FSL M7-1455 TaxID=2975316 RepID=UPI0030F4E761
MIVENLEQYQPRFRIWLRSLGVLDGGEVSLSDYMAWAFSKAEEYKRQVGVIFLNETGHQEFTEWLENEL